MGQKFVVCFWQLGCRFCRGPRVQYGAGPLFSPLHPMLPLLPADRRVDCVGGLWEPEWRDGSVGRTARAPRPRLPTCHRGAASPLGTPSVAAVEGANFSQKIRFLRSKAAASPGIASPLLQTREVRVSCVTSCQGGCRNHRGEAAVRVPSAGIHSHLSNSQSRNFAGRRVARGRCTSEPAVELINRGPL